MPDKTQRYTAAEWRREAAARLGGRSDSPLLDVDLLLSAILARPRQWLRAHSDHVLPPDAHEKLEDALRQRLDQVPVAYITGTQAFWTLELEVTPDTLVPRPETELVVERALALLADLPANAEIADLGTGSGNIALAIASEKPATSITASDLSSAALAVARRNARRVGVTNVSFIEGDWCGAFGAQRFDLIVSNPPYVEANYPALASELRAEPLSALASGPDGLDDIRRLAAQLPAHLKPGGYVLIEHGHMQAQAVSGILRSEQFVAIRTYNDLAGHPRVTEAQLAHR